MFSFIKRMSAPFTSLGSKLAGGFASVGNKLGNLFRGGEAIGRVGREAVITGGKGFDFVNLPLFETMGTAGNQFLRPFDRMSNVGSFTGF